MKKAYAELRRRPFLTPVWLMAFAGALALVLIVLFLASITTTTVIVVRHAEKELGSIEDPPLSQAGEQRALELARMFGDRHTPGRIDAIIASDTRRSQRTAEPLAERLGLNITTLPADVDGLVRRIHSEYRGRNVLVVGHSNTVPELVRRLGSVGNVPAMGEDDYGTIYIVTVPTLGRASVLRMTY